MVIVLRLRTTCPVGVRDSVPESMHQGIGVRRENLHLRCDPGPLQGDQMHVVAESSVFVNGNHGDIAGAVICHQHEATAWIDGR